MEDKGFDIKSGMEVKACSRCDKTPAFLVGLAFNNPENPGDIQDIYLCQDCSDDLMDDDKDGYWNWRDPGDETDG